MEEILEKIESEINSIKEEQAKLEELAERSAKLKEEEKQLNEELNTIKDTKSGFYQDAKQKVDEKHQEFMETNNDRMNRERELDRLIDEKKAEIRKQIAAQKQYLDENRNVDLADLRTIDVDKLRTEKEKLDREIELNSITREEFDKKSDLEKKEIRKAKENYLNNKHRLAEINPKLQLIDALDGKTPKEKFMELDNLDRKIESDFNKNSFDNIVHDIDKRKEEKEDIETLLEQMIAGREKREEERYYEDVKSGLEETEKRKQREEKDGLEDDKENGNQEETKNTEEPNEEIKKKIEQIKKETEAANRNYKDIHLKVGPQIDVTQIKKQKEMDRIVSIRIDEKNGTIYTKTKDGKIEKELLSEAIAAKKNLNAILKVKEMCKEIAGGRISGLLLGTKVNPAIVYALRKEPKEIRNYITCLKEQKELPFELFHDLRDSNLNIMNRVKMWVHARAEDKLPGTTVILSDRRWNKNKTIEAPKETKKSEAQKNKTKAQEVYEPFTMYKQVKRDKDKPIADYRVENSDNHIEKNATEKILQEEQGKRAKEIEKFMPDAVLDENENVVTDLGEEKE